MDGDDHRRRPRDRGRREEVRAHPPHRYAGTHGGELHPRRRVRARGPHRQGGARGGGPARRSEGV